MTAKSSSPYKKNPGLSLQNPVDTLKQHGMHGAREESQSETSPIRRIRTLPIASIRPGRYQKRETVNREKYLVLKNQIQEFGLQFTAVVCVDPDDARFYNLMMGGHLRLQAAVEVGITEVQVIIREYNSVEMAKGTYFENNGRQAFTLIEEGLLFIELQEQEGWSQEEIAKQLCTSRPHVSACILAANSAPDIQRMLHDIPTRGLRCSYALRRLDQLGQEKAVSLRAPIIEDFKAEKISTDEVEQLVNQILAREQGKEPEKKVSIESAKAQERTLSIVKSFDRYAKFLGDRPPSLEERSELVKVKERIELFLSRSQE